MRTSSLTGIRHRLHRLSAGVALMMTASLLTVTPSMAAGDDWVPDVQQMRSVSGTDVNVEDPPADPAQAAAKRPTPAPVWPEPETATVSLPATAKDTRGLRAPAKGIPAGHVRAGKTPVWIGAGKARPAKPAAGKAVASVDAPSEVRVRVASQELSDRAGLHGVVLSLARADSAAGPGSVALGIDYSQFAYGAGGDWADRLRLVQLPECVLTTPELTECQATTPVESHNDSAANVVSAEVAAPPAATAGAAGKRKKALDSPAASGVFALLAARDGSTGSYAATPLSPSATWQVGQQTGDFSWSYPLRVPPAVNGPTPDLSISYSSGSVDGRTASTNAQPSWLGEGHSLESGYVERKYVSCHDDMPGGINTKKTFDQCWKTDNANVVLGGHSGELVKAADGTWRLRNDDGSRMERIGGPNTGAGINEHWRLTTTDGTQYYFGKGKRHATDTAVTNSRWTVPVFGNHAKASWSSQSEPCFKSGNMAGSSCEQPWRWNLDYVVDPHGNTMTYFYKTETNYYGRNDNTAISAYTRGGWLDRIEYGDREGKEGLNTAASQVQFTVAERCDQAVTTVNCATAPLTKAVENAWPDVPFDQICAGATPTTAPKSCPDGKAPSFFTRKRLTGVSTSVRSGTTYTAVDSWSFGQTFPDPGDGTAKGLWLASITHTGKVGGSAALAPIAFTGVQLDNRVDKLGDGAPALTKWRIAGVNTETGSRLSVNYKAPDCTASSKPVSPEANTRRCFPVYWAKEGEEVPTLNYFHKHVVDTVVEDDLTGGGLDKVTRFAYLDAPAWHYDDNELTLPRYRTWGEWRGFGRVQMRVGEPGPQTLTETRYMRGMDEDRLPNNGKREATVTDSQGTKIPDHPRTNGFVREQIVYNGVSGNTPGAVVSGTINDPWISAATAGNGADTAFLLGTAKSRGRTPLAAGGTRVTETATTFDAHAQPLTIDNRGDVATDTDDLCTRTSYARDTTAWILTTPSETETVSAKCADAPVRPADVVSATRVFYDGLTVLGQLNDHGNVTRTETLSDWVNGNPVYLSASKATYDVHGRVLSVTDAKSRTTTTAYTPAEGGPVTSVKTTDPKKHTNVTTLNTAWGVPTTETDANDKRTDLGYDPLGRLTAVWLPGRPRASNGDSPSMKFGYLVRPNGATAVSSSERRNNGSYTTSYALYDGLLRPRQTQVPAANGTGRVLTDTIYDARGQVLDNNGPYYDSAKAPGTDLFSVTDVQIPSQTRTSYDGAGRPIAATFRVLGVDKWSTTTVHGGDRVTVTPPAGATRTTTITDARGRPTALRQYDSASPTGAYDETTYTHTPDGKIASVTDPAKNVWRYTYDLLGRQITADDPDKGHTATTYDNVGQVASVTDARSKKVFYDYDELGRRIAAHDGSATGPKLSEWTYDTLTDGTAVKGLATSSTRWIADKPYVSRITGYDDMDRPTGGSLTIPETPENAGIAGTYSSATTYNPDGGLKTLGLPAVPGLDAETLDYAYDSQGKLNRLGGDGSYVNGTTFSPFGEVLQLALGQTPDKFTWQTFYYQEGTRRLDRAKVDRAGFPELPAADTRYSYDPAGNVLKIRDTPAGEPADTQCFRADYLRRMTEAWTPNSDNCESAPTVSALGGPAPYWQSYRYDKTGNRKSAVSHAPAGDTTRTYEYPEAGSPQPHALRKVITDGPAGQRLDTFEYDETGNTKTRTITGNAQSMVWDIEGRLESVTDAKGTTGYVYDADGTRLIRRDPQGTTLYLSGTEIHIDNATKKATSTRHYDHAGRTIAVRTSAGVEFLASDQHGTADISINATTLAVTRRRTAPFGTPRDASPVDWVSERGFVGGTLDRSTGLTHLGAREYDPVDGRFLSVDPIIDHGDPQQMNGYAYGNNNPVTFSDPDGLFYHPSGPSPSGSPPGTWTGYYGNGTPGDGIDTSSAVNEADKAVNKARAKRDAQMRKLIKAATEIAKIVSEVLGITAGFNCFTKGDVGACVETAINVLMSAVGGFVAKIIAKYAWKFRAGARIVKSLYNLGGEVFSAFKGWRKAGKQLKAAEGRAAAARKAAESCKVNSFTPDTRILVAGGQYKPIDKVKVGDKVVATDPETGKTKIRPVVATIVGNGTKHLVDVTIDTDGAEGNQTGSVVATANHPFWVANRKAWIHAGDLHPGDQVRAADGKSLHVTATRSWHNTQRVHNLTVQDIHTYYVVAGDTPVLVHNCGPDVTAMAADATSEVSRGVTKASRAYQKHMDRPGTTLIKLGGRDARDMSENLVEDILTNPKTAVQSWSHPTFGDVHDLRLSDISIRFNSKNEFIGFLD